MTMRSQIDTRTVATTEHSAVAVAPAGSTETLPPPYYLSMENIDLSTAKRPQPDAKIASVQQQVDDTVVLMRNNMTMALERDAQIMNLENKADELSDASKRFKRTTGKVERAQWRASLKWTIVLVFAIILLILVVILILQPWKW